VPKKGGFILASNHVSYLDPVALAFSCPRKLNFMAKEELFRNSLFGYYLSRVGVFPVKRNTADRVALREALKRLSEGKPLLLFPEGTRGDGVIAANPLAGVGFLAVKGNVPVVPAFVSGSDKALPRGKKFFGAAKLSVTFGKQIFIEKSMPYQEIAQQIMESIRHLAANNNLTCPS